MVSEYNWHLRFKNSIVLYCSYFRVKDPTPDFEDYIENTMKYCPKQNESICIKFKTRLEEQGIECNEDRAARLKVHLQWKCENKRFKSRKQEATIKRSSDNDKLYPEHDLLPGYIRPNSYEIWLWIQYKPIVIGNITINVIVDE